MRVACAAYTYRNHKEQTPAWPFPQTSLRASGACHGERVGRGQAGEQRAMLMLIRVPPRATVWWGMSWWWAPCSSCPTMPVVGSECVEVECVRKGGDWAGGRIKRELRMYCRSVSVCIQRVWWMYTNTDLAVLAVLACLLLCRRREREKRWIMHEDGHTPMRNAGFKWGHSPHTQRKSSNPPHTHEERERVSKCITVQHVIHHSTQSLSYSALISSVCPARPQGALPSKQTSANFAPILTALQGRYLHRFHHKHAWTSFITIYYYYCF